MPYIDAPLRGYWESRGLQPLEDEIAAHNISPGELNFVFTRLAQAYVRARGLRYRTLNDVMGVLTAVREEFYRRIVAPYEDQKRQQYGDVLNVGEPKP